MNRRDYWVAAAMCAATWFAFTGWAYWYLLRVAG